MDSLVQLALMAKAKMVFESPGNFLSFPVLTPLTFHPAQLDFSNALSDPTVGAALLDFSRQVNSCPADPIPPPAGTDYLWSNYDAWLTAMTLANDQLDATSQSHYDAARALLVAQDANGLDTDSPMVVAYKQCRDALFNAQQAYTAAEIGATASGPDALTSWQANQAPLLQSAIDSANAAWLATGHKADVEAAQSTLAQCSARMPHTVWSAWRKLYSPEIDGITLPATGEWFMPSVFAPSNLAEQPWNTLYLSGSEIATLAAGAPPSLRAVFGDLPTSSITSVSFECRSSAIVRPWFSPAMFRSRFWKFPDGSQLSDGASPAQGVWPAYVSGVVFVRNVKTVNAQAGPAAPQPMPVFDMVRLANPPQAVAAPPRLTPPELMVRPTASLIAASPPLAPRLFAARPMQAVSLQMPATILNPPTPQPIANNKLLRLQSSAYKTAIWRGLPPAVQEPTAPPPPPVGAPAPPPPDDSIAVLAFICTTLPKCPDPDLGLTWT